MKRDKLTAMLLFLVSLPAWGHDHSVVLEPGQSLWGLNWYVTTSNTVFPSYRGRDGVVEVIDSDVGNNEFRSGWSGDVLSWEYAVARGWSLGVKTNPYNAMGQYLVHGKWNIQGAVFTNFDLTPALGSWSPESFRLFAYQELQLAPLYATKGSNGDGLLNAFTTLSTNWRWLDTEEIMVSTYLDAKAITSFAHPYYRYPWMKPPFYLYDIYAIQGLTAANDVKVEFWPTTRIALEAGIEARVFANTVLLLGLNYPLTTILRRPDGTIGPFTVAGVPKSEWTQLFQQQRWELEVKFLLK